MICNGAVEADKTLPWYESKIEMLLILRYLCRLKANCPG